MIRCLARIPLILAAVLMCAAYSHAEKYFSVVALLSNDSISRVGSTIRLEDKELVVQIPVDRLRTLLEVHNKIREASGQWIHLYVFASKDFNAFAAYPTNSVYFSTALIDQIGSDADMVAAVMGHEHAHLILRHTFQEMLANQTFSDVARMQANAVYRGTGNRREAIAEYVVNFLVYNRAFSRAQEKEADKFGTELMVKAGYKPEGVARFMQLLANGLQPMHTRFMSTHPGMIERMTSVVPTINDQRFEVMARDLVENKDWKQLAELVRQWIKAVPTSARAWYHQGGLLERSRRPGVVEAYERAVTNDPSFTTAWLELCVSLFKAGREKDSVRCAENLPHGEWRLAYDSRTAQEIVLVGGSVPTTTAFWRAVDHAGNPVITSSPQTINNMGLAPRTITFPWSPGREKTAP